MPRTDRALRRCYLKRMVIEGDVPMEARRATEPDIYSFSPREQTIDILPVIPYLKERRRGGSLTPPGKRKQPPIIPVSRKQSSRKIRFSEDGDHVRTYSPFRDYSEEVLLSPRYIDDFLKEQDKQAPVHKKPKKKRKKTSSKESKSSQRAQEDEWRRRQELERFEREATALEEERLRRERETRILELERQKDEEKRTAKQRAQQERARQEQIKKQQEERWQREREAAAKNAAKKSTIKRSQSTGNLNQKKAPSTKSKKKSGKSHQKTITPLHPRWNYVGDPTRKAYTTQPRSYLSDFHF